MLVTTSKTTRHIQVLLFILIWLSFVNLSTNTSVCKSCWVYLTLKTWQDENTWFSACFLCSHHNFLYHSFSALKSSFSKIHSSNWKNTKSQWEIRYNWEHKTTDYTSNCGIVSLPQYAQCSTINSVPHSLTQNPWQPLITLLSSLFSLLGSIV